LIALSGSGEETTFSESDELLFEIGSGKLIALSGSGEEITSSESDGPLSENEASLGSKLLNSSESDVTIFSGIR
jgi:hypothetical protein